MSFLLGHHMLGSIDYHYAIVYAFEYCKHFGNALEMFYINSI